MLLFRINVVSDKGIQREANEDMVSINGTLVRDDTYSKELILEDDQIVYALVADGMGGHEKGEYASEYTLRQIKNNISGIFNFEKQFPELIGWVGADLNRKAVDEGQARPMGCTLTGVVWFKGKLWVVNAGDSRTYRLREGLLRMLTEDEDLNHKYGADLGADGLALYNCIGGGCNSDITLEDYTDRIEEDDVLMVCSDGLTDMVPDDVIEQMLQEPDAARKLVNKANEQGGVDNISVVVIQIRPVSEMTFEKDDIPADQKPPKDSLIDKIINKFK